MNKINNNELYQKGIAYWQSHDLQNAKNVFREILLSQPNNPEILSYLGILNLQLNQFESGITSLKKALDFAPGDQNIKANLINGLINFSNFLIKDNEFIQARSKLEDAINLHPNNEIAIENLIKLNNELKEYKSNDLLYESIKKYDIKNANIFYVYGNSIFDQKRYHDAIQIYQLALNIKPDFVECLFNLALCQRFLGNISESKELYKLLNRYAPNDVKVKYFRSLFLLSINEFEEGWEYYKYRWKAKKIEAKYYIKNKPQISSINHNCNKTFLWSEQGIGDVILHTSMLGDFLSLNKKVEFAVDKRLIPIFSRSFPEVKFFDTDSEINNIEFDGHLPIADIGSFVRKNIADFKNQKKQFLYPDKLLQKEYSKILKSDNKKICGFSCYSKNQALKDKSIQPDDFFSHLQNFNFKFVNLDYVDNSQEIKSSQSKFNLDIDSKINIDKFNDIDSLAALIASCDLIITVSNVTAHLAGALGIKTFLLIKKGPTKFWYWEDQKISKFYPMITILESDDENWNKTLEKLKKEISIL